MADPAGGRLCPCGTSSRCESGKRYLTSVADVCPSTGWQLGTGRPACSECRAGRCMPDCGAGRCMPDCGAGRCMPDCMHADVGQAVSVCCCCAQEEALAEQAMEAEVDLRSLEAAHPQDASGRDAGSWQGSWGELSYTQDDLGSNGSGRPSSSEPGLASSAGSDASSSSGGPTASPLSGCGLAGGAGPTPPSSAAAPAAPGKLSARYIRDEQENKRWPVLREGDGGRHVHALHAALERSGYWPGEDDMRWWQYGDATVSALQSAQVSSAHMGA